jgi:DNA-binding LacI/PurR family transcriptional regulator
MTVSRALRQDPEVTPAMAAKVLKVASELGYRPHPMISSLMANVRKGKLERESQILAYLISHADWNFCMRTAAYRDLYAGVVERGAEIGFRVERFSLAEPGMNGKRMSAILRARNITGIIVAPSRIPGSTIDLEWSDFATVLVGYSWDAPAQHRVANHHVHSMRLALRQLKEAGYRRLGLAVGASVAIRVDHGFDMPYYMQQLELDVEERIPWITAEPLSKALLLEWFERYRPEAVIGLDCRIVGWLREAGHRVPEDVGYVNLSYSPRMGDVAAVDQNSRDIGAAAVDVVAEQLYHNQRGLPIRPKVVMIESAWVAGRTIGSLAGRNI